MKLSTKPVVKKTMNNINIDVDGDFTVTFGKSCCISIVDGGTQVLVRNKQNVLMEQLEKAGVHFLTKSQGILLDKSYMVAVFRGDIWAFIKKNYGKEIYLTINQETGGVQFIKDDIVEYRTLILDKKRIFSEQC